MVMSLVIHFLALLAMVGSVLLETSKMINWGLAVAEFTAGKVLLSFFLFLFFVYFYGNSFLKLYMPCQV